MGIKEALKSLFSKNERFKEMEQELRFQKKLEDRQKSSDEREVEAFLEKRRQEQLHNQVRQIHEFEKRKHWNGGFGNSSNIFQGHKSILSEDKNEFFRSSLI